ncbi:MAG TPA: TIGR03667 family PPOX class F420-dependent oxidoreductase [Anaerolineales bacterium]|nr:TIGR03667 family PPOX class F420-dependent oxidoreductase [Anaerolineales bacterium]
MNIPDFKSKFGRVAMQRVKKEYFIWLTTVDSSGTPQPRPVWFVWEDDSFLIYSQAKAHKLKHIQRNPQVSLHFNSTDNKGESRVVVITGKARIDAQCPPAHKHRAYLRKYKDGIRRLGAAPEQFSAEYSIAIRITPAKLRGWE